MKVSNKMKALSLAVLGLTGMAFGSSAFAACPTDPAQPNGPWSSKSTVFGAIAISANGFNGTSCKLDTQITNAAPGGTAFVRDNSPASEPRYRARFFVNADAVALNSLSGQAVRIFTANTETPYQNIGETIRLSLIGNTNGTAKFLTVAMGCDGVPGNICSKNIPLAAGTNKIQIDWVKNANATVKIWVNSDTEGAPTDTLAGNTNGWVVDYAAMGLFNPTAGYRSAHLNKIISFDEFDSRRSTFIN